MSEGCICHPPRALVNVQTGLGNRLRKPDRRSGIEFGDHWAPLFFYLYRGINSGPQQGNHSTKSLLFPFLAVSSRKTHLFSLKCRMTAGSLVIFGQVSQTAGTWRVESGLAVWSLIAARVLLSWLHRASCWQSQAQAWCIFPKGNFLWSPASQDTCISHTGQGLF